MPESAAPYRPPCGGWPTTNRWWLGAPEQHFIAAHKAVPRFINTTKVPDYHSPPGVDINPYEQPNVPSSIPDCGDEVLCGVTGEPDCGPWPEPVPANTFEESGTVDLSTCRKRGFKNVQAMKWWHGRWGYDSSNWFAPDSMEVFALTTPHAKGQILSECRSEVSSPDGTHYLTLDVVASVVVTGDTLGGHGGARTVEATSTMTVDRQSGVRTGSASIPSGMSVDDEAFISFLLGKAAENANSVFETFKGVINAHCLAGDIGGTLTLSNTGSEYVWTWAYSGGETIWQITVDAIAGTFRDEQWFYEDPTTTGSDLWSHGYELWTVSGSSLTYVNFNDVLLDLSPFAQTLTCTATLSDPYTGADLDDDIAGLLDEWNLADDAEYPWREDLHVSEAPLVVRHEVQNYVEPVAVVVDGTYVDANAANFTGAILGSPLSAGYQGFFDFRHEVWRKCYSGSDQWYIRGFGSAAPGYLPQNSTHWTNYNQAYQWGRRGAFVIHFPGVRVAQKWAEAKEHRPSHNYFRPCGPDRFIMDETTARCILSSSGSPVVVTVETDDGAPDIDTGDHCVACGIGVDAGLYAVTKLADDEYELTTLLAPLPAGYACSGLVLAKVRFDDVWSICGRIKVVIATNESPIRITLAEGAPYLRTGDSVTISGVGGNTAANGTFFWTRISDTEGTLDGSTGDGDLSAPGWMQSAGAPEYQWFDDRSKGDFVVHQWHLNHRDLGEYNRRVASGCLTPTTAPRADQMANGLEQSVDEFICSTHCLPFIPCCPAVICISPNGEDFINGLTLPFGDVLADDVYGDASQAAPVWSVDDPLWQVPRRPCGFYGDTFAWLRDPGTCAADGSGTRYYPVPLQVEARCAPPSAAPAPPAGCFVGWLSQEDLDVPGPVSGNVANPPFPLASDSGGAPVTVPTPWSIFSGQEACVCELGRFAAEYERDGVICPDPEFIP